MRPLRLHGIGMTLNKHIQSKVITHTMKGSEICTLHVAIAKENASIDLGVIVRDVPSHCNPRLIIVAAFPRLMSTTP